MTKKLLVRLGAVILSGSLLIATTMMAFAMDRYEPIQVEPAPVVEQTIETPPVIVIETEQPKPKTETFYTKCSVNVRIAPSTDDEPYMTIPYGTKVEVLSEFGDWYSIQLETGKFFIKSEYLIDEATWNTIPLSDQVPLSNEVQAYLWQKCKENNIPYTFFLATIDFESNFNPNAFNKRTVDRGLCQVNKCWVDDFQKMGWISCADDLFDPFINIDCGMYVMMEAINQFGVCERAYAFYNTGKKGVKSNKNSRQVMKDWAKWQSILGEI